MKALYALFLAIGGLSCVACVNKIEDETRQSNIPISFSSKIKKGTTKVTGNAFDTGDRIGLFATLTNGTLDQQRYIDNLRLDYGGDSKLIPQKEVYYPEGDAQLDFISYFPYQAGGIPQGSTLLNIAVESEQNKLSNYSLSNFMTAQTDKVGNDEEEVKLEYKHRLAKIKLILIPKQGEKVDDMLTANPRIVATGFKTQAVYNLQTDKIEQVIEGSETDILPFGSWKKESDGTLAGKEFIVIPQAYPDNKQAFILEWNGKIYTCALQSTTIKEDTQLEIKISTAQSASSTLTGVVANIKEWGFNESQTTENEYNATAIHTASFSFSTSDVYRIYHQGRPVAEVCREYLRTANQTIDAKAITVYPVLKNEKTDLSNGIVLRLPDKSVANHGGKISWNSESNALTYTPGNSKPIEKFYIAEDGKIIPNQPSPTALTVNISNYIIRDIRNGVLQTYPIVKVGTQYWMKEDLQPTRYTDNTAIPLKSALGTGTAYFEWADYDLKLYNGEALLTGKIAPDDWTIPSESDWSKLITYVGNNASALKKKSAWTQTTETSPATDETGLSILPNGLFIEKGGKQTLMNHGSSVVYWAFDETHSKLNQVIILNAKDNDIAFKTTIKAENKDYYNAFSIRCLKE